MLLQEGNTNMRHVIFAICGKAWSSRKHFGVEIYRNLDSTGCQLNTFLLEFKRPISDPNERDEDDLSSELLQTS